MTSKFNNDVDFLKQVLEISVPIRYAELSDVDHLISIIERFNCLLFKKTPPFPQNIIELNIHSILKKIGYTEGMDAKIKSLNKAAKGKYDFEILERIMAKESLTL